MHRARTRPVLRRMAALSLGLAAALAAAGPAAAAAWSRAADHTVAAEPASDAWALAAALSDGGLTDKVLGKTAPLVARSLARVEAVGPEISDGARPLLEALVVDQLRGHIRGRLIPALVDAYLDSFSSGELDAMMSRRLSPEAAADRPDQPDHTSFLRQVNGRLGALSIEALGESFAAGRDLIARDRAALPVAEPDRAAAIELLDLLARLTERHAQQLSAR